MHHEISYLGNKNYKICLHQSTGFNTQRDGEFINYFASPLTKAKIKTLSVSSKYFQIKYSSKNRKVSNM